MGFIVEINGYKAVGKSTLIAGLKERFPTAVFREGFHKIKNGLDLTNEQQFYENERIYIEREIKEFNEFIKNDKLVILLRGPEECLFFAKYAPKLKFNFDWNVEQELYEELKKLEQYHADCILWLDADKDTLYSRKEHDNTKPRLNMESWNKTWNPYIGNYIKNFDYTQVLDTTSMTKEQVLDWTISWIYKRMREKNMLQVPERLYIETTNACNAKCIMCPHSHMKRQITFMNDNVFKKIIDELKTINLENTTIFMHKEGEPFLDKSITEKIKIVKQNTNCHEVAINTNASLLDENTIDKLITSGIDTIYLSVDGIKKESYEKIRVGLSFDVVKNNILMLFQKIQNMNVQIKVIIQMLVTHENIEETTEFETFWKKYPCEVFIKKMHSYLDGGKSYITEKLSDTQKSVCTDPFNMLVIYADGTMGCCCWDYENLFHIGDINTETILSAFNGEKIKKIRQMHSEHQCKNLIPCNKCMRIFGDDMITGISNGKEIKIQ